MNQEPIYGVITYPNNSRGNDYLYRVALKAYITNQRGELLLVKETGRDWWDIPGGGLDHGESIKDGLARELHEEVGYEGDFQFEPLYITEPQLLDQLHLIQVRIVFLVTTEHLNFKPGDDGDEVTFMNTETFKNSDLRTEQEIYYYSQLAEKRNR